MDENDAESSPTIDRESAASVDLRTGAKMVSNGDEKEAKCEPERVKHL